MFVHVVWRMKSSSGKGLEFDALLRNFGGNELKSNGVKRRDLVREATNVLVAQLQKLKAEKMEAKRIKKEEKAKKKASKMMMECKDSSSSKSPSSSESDCDNVMNMKEIMETKKSFKAQIGKVQEIRSCNADGEFSNSGRVESDPDVAFFRTNVSECQQRVKELQITWKSQDRAFLTSSTNRLKFLTRVCKVVPSIRTLSHFAKLCQAFDCTEKLDSYMVRLLLLFCDMMESNNGRKMVMAVFKVYGDDESSTQMRILLTPNGGA
ncbi:thioredoxin-like fold protein [Tanacetum coccineum]